MKLPGTLFSLKRAVGITEAAAVPSDLYSDFKSRFGAKDWGCDFKGYYWVKAVKVNDLSQ